MTIGIVTMEIFLRRQPRRVRRQPPIISPLEPVR
jgi:hypothetical protein